MRRSYPISYWKVRTSRRIKSHWTQTETHRLSPSSNTRYIHFFAIQIRLFRNAQHPSSPSGSECCRSTEMCEVYFVDFESWEYHHHSLVEEKKPNNRIPSVLCYSHNVAKKKVSCLIQFSTDSKSLEKMKYFPLNIVIYHDFFKCVVVGGDIFLQIHRYWYSVVSSLFWLKSPYSSEGD